MNNYLELNPVLNLMIRHKRSLTICAIFVTALSSFTGSLFAQSTDQPEALETQAADNATRQTTINSPDFDTCSELCVLADGRQDGSADDTDAATLQVTMNWSKFAYVDSGYRSSTAMRSSGLIVEVHDSTNEVYTTGSWYHIGKVNASDTKVDWGPSRHLTCCFAMYPSVAITNEGYVIFTFSTGKSKKDSLLKIMAGTLDVNGGVDQTIQWKTERLPFDSGYHNTLSVNANGVIAEAHESGSGDKGLYYRLGHLKDPANGDFSVAWDTGDYGKNYADDIDPHISINDSGEVGEVHQASANDHKLHYIRGKLKANSIEFNKSQPKYNGQRLRC
jgi:hypothetical protein